MNNTLTSFLCMVLAMTTHKRQEQNIKGIFHRGEIPDVEFLLLYTDTFKK
jgi:hypothetical protein